MPSPKLERLLDVVATRCHAIRQSGGYYTDVGFTVRRDRREPATDADVPCVLVFAGERVAQSTSPKGARASMEVTVIGYASRFDESERVGIRLLADLSRAIELDDTDLDGFLRAQYGLEWVSDEIFLPESGASVVGARITYSAPHVRLYGDPEIL